MADNNFFFKVLAELSDTEYFTFKKKFPLTVGGWVRPLVENSTNFIFETFSKLLFIIWGHIVSPLGESLFSDARAGRVKVYMEGRS